MRRLLPALVVLAGLLACGDRAPPEPVDVTPPPEARLVGQRYTVDGRRCFDEQRRPTVRVESTERAGWQVRWGSTVLPAEIEARAGGVLLRPGAAPTTPSAVLTVESNGRPVARWPVCWGPPPAERPALREAVELRKAGQGEQAAALLEARLPQMAPIDAALGWMELGRVRRRAGDLAGTRAAWDRAVDRARSVALNDLAGAFMRSTIWLALWQQDFTDAAARIEHATTLGERVEDADGRLRLAYNRGLLAIELGDFVGARRILEQARAEAWALGLDPVVELLDEARATVLAALGRYPEALALDPPNHTGLASMNRGWLLLQAMDAGALAADHDRVAALFERAQAAFAAEGDAPLAAVNGLNVAWLALRRGRVSRAREVFQDVRADAAEGYAADFARLLDAELAAAEGDTDAARAAYARAEAAVEANPAGSDVGWRAALGHARVLKRAGQTAAALDAYRRALVRLDRLGRGTGVRDDRAAFFADRAPLVDESIDALVAAERYAEAFAVADRARARVVRALEAGLRIGRLDPEARAEWTRQAQAFTAAGAELETLRERARTAWRDEDKAALAAARAAAVEARAEAFERAWRFLKEAAPADVDRPLDVAALRARLGADGTLLLQRRRANGGFDAFRVTAAGVEHSQRSDPLIGWLDAPSARLYLILDGGEAGARVATHPVGERPLATVRAVSRLPYAAALLRPPSEAGGRPLVVADPRGDLSEAAAEGRAVARRLDGRLLLGGAASPDTVRAGLDGAPLFHFAGHGDLRGSSPWAAHLRLAGDGRLSLEDVLLWRPQVGLVVLSGCRTGARLALAAGEVIGLPEAFMAAGSDAVLVTRRDVPDAAARRFVERFYAAGGAEQPAEALVEAAAADHAAGGEMWSAFELWGG